MNNNPNKKKIYRKNRKKERTAKNRERIEDYNYDLIKLLISKFTKKQVKQHLLLFIIKK